MVIAYFESIAYCKFANDELGLDIDIPDSLWFKYYEYPKYIGSI